MPNRSLGYHDIAAAARPGENTVTWKVFARGNLLGWVCALVRMNGWPPLHVFKRLGATAVRFCRIRAFLRKMRFSGNNPNPESVYTDVVHAINLRAAPVPRHCDNRGAERRRPMI